IMYYVFFFFQAEDGIRDDLVTGVQTCALPILRAARILGSNSLKQPESKACLIRSLARPILPMVSAVNPVMKCLIGDGFAPNPEVPALFSESSRSVRKTSFMSPNRLNHGRPISRMAFLA